MTIPFCLSLISLMLSQAGGSVTVVVDLGERSDVNLPCKFKGKFSLSDNYYSWQLEKSLIYSFDGRSQEAGLDGRYRGRTGSGGDQERGELTLNLSQVTPYDEGSYTCHIFTKIPDRRKIHECNVRLQIVANYTPPVIKEGAARPDGLLLSCVTRGGFPEPRVEWTDGRGLPVPAATGEEEGRTRDPHTGRWSVNSSRRVPLPPAHANYTCTVTNTRSGQTERDTWRVRSPDPTTPDPRQGSAATGVAVTCGLLSLLVLFTIGVVFWFKRCGKLGGSSRSEFEMQSKREQMDTTVL